MISVSSVKTHTITYTLTDTQTAHYTHIHTHTHTDRHTNTDIHRHTTHMLTHTFTRRHTLTFKYTHLHRHIVHTHTHSHTHYLGISSQCHLPWMVTVIGHGWGMGWLSAEVCCGVPALCWTFSPIENRFCSPIILTIVSPPTFEWSCIADGHRGRV